jgi:putative flippase GtrA
VVEVSFVRRIVRDARLLRFLTVGGLCFVTNLAVLYGGTDLLGWHYLLSMALSIVVANTLGWLLNRRWTFGGSERPWWAEYARYMSVSLSSTLISLILMFIGVSLLGIHYLLASAVIAVGMLLFNFIAHRDWSFGASADAPGRSSSRS